VTRLHDPAWRGFASDNYAGVHPEVLAALADANEGHQVSYGEDVYTARLAEVIREQFGADAEVFPVFNGTGANVVALTSLLPRWGAVVASRTSHIHSDEGGAPEKVTGLKLFVVPTPDGKLTPELIATEAWGWGDEHRAQPLAVSITQTTELGTLYTPAEVRAIADYAHEHGMALHMDGARLWNAAAALGVPFREFTVDAGVDILSFGGTKIGLLGAEAVVVLDQSRVDGLGLAAASHANAMAARLRGALEELALPGLGFSQATQANAVFAVLANEAADNIRQKVRFYDWDRAAGEVRWMTAFDTTEADVDAFVEVIRAELA
jgi:threonine aldolase